MVEHVLCKHGVAGSNPVRSIACGCEVEDVGTRIPADGHRSDPASDTDSP